MSLIAKAHAVLALTTVAALAAVGQAAAQSGACDGRVAQSQAGSPRSTRTYPIACGTFIQWFLVQHWDDARWRAEYRCLKQAGMRYVVLEPTVDDNAHAAYYPTALPGYHQAAGYPDIVDACLRNAELEGMQVFLGMNFDDVRWWRLGARNPDWLLGEMDAGNAVADELYARYGRRYPRAFAGWYWVWEVDNGDFVVPARRDVLASALDRSVRHLHAIAPDLPVLLCPFMNSHAGTPEAYAAMWQYVFAHCALGRGDIFCPQDGVGAHQLLLRELPAWFKALAGAVRTRPGLRFWSDTETFDSKDWSSAPLERFVAQLRAVQPYVEQSLTFAYSHYYSPLQKPAGYHRAYVEYVRTGRLDSSPTRDDGPAGSRNPAPHARS